MLKKIISAVVALTFLTFLPVYAESELPPVPQSSELTVSAPTGATAVTTLNNLNLTKSGAVFSVANVVDYNFVDLSNGTGCYKFSRKSGTTTGIAYFMNASSFTVKPNRGYKLSALVYCDFDRTDCEVNLGFSVFNENNKETLVDAFHGLPAKTNGWVRFETTLTTPFDASTARFYGLLHGFNEESDGSFYLADVDMWELPETALTPLSEGEGLTFGGSSGMYNMMVETPTVTAQTVTVKTNGARYSFNKQNNTITAEQIIGKNRTVAEIELNYSLSSLSVYSATEKEVILTTGSGGISFGIQMDGLMLISPQGADATVKVTSKINGEWNRLHSGNLLTQDSIGGFTVNPAIPLNTGRTPRYSASSNVDFLNIKNNTSFISSAKAGWNVTYTVSCGERLGVTVFPPREYDWANSFDSIYANVDTDDTSVWQNYKSAHGVKYGVIFNATERAWGMSYGTTYTPKDETNFKAHISAAKSAEVVPTEYMSMYFWDYSLDDYINEVARHKTEYGIEGVYTDGLPPLDWLSAYEGIRRLREVFPNGCIIAHTTGQSANGGPPLAAADIYIPAIDSYCTFTLRGEQVEGDGKDWLYPRYVSSGYGTSNAYGILKGDSWKNGESEADQTEQNLISLLYNGRARKTGDLTPYREVLAKLEANYKANANSENFADYYEKCYLPYARRLVREKLSNYPTSTVINEFFGEENAFNKSLGGTVENGMLKIASSEKINAEFLSIYGKTELSFNVTLTNSTGIKLYLKDVNGNNVASISQSGSSLRYLHKSGGYAKLGVVQSGKTVLAKIIVDPANHNLSIKFGDIVKENVPMVVNTAEISGFEIINNGTDNIFIDNLSVKSGL